MDSKIEKTDHPDLDERVAQQDFLNRQTEEQREKYAYIFRVDNLLYRFHSLKDCEPDEDDFQKWIDDQDEPIRDSLKKLGLEGCKNMGSLRRFTVEHSERAFLDYMKKHLTESEFQRWYDTHTD